MKVVAQGLNPFSIKFDPESLIVLDSENPHEYYVCVKARETDSLRELCSDLREVVQTSLNQSCIYGHNFVPHITLMKIRDINDLGKEKVIQAMQTNTGSKSTRSMWLAKIWLRIGIKDIELELGD